jgi:tetratricopeptide (TPR) repeat protein
MKPIRLLALSSLLALGAPTVSAQDLCGDACRRMLNAAHALEGQGKYQEALEQYRAAEKAEPLASLPFASEAGLILHLSAHVKPDQTEAWRAAARAKANQALKLWANDPVAQEVLRQMDDDGPSPLHQPNPDAARLSAEAEVQFAQQHYEQALPKYQAAAQADPRYSAALVGAGDCYFAQKDWARAETLFRRATEIEPLNSQAWRYLADTLVIQDQRAAAEAALLSAIAADPSQGPNWGKLASLRAHAGKPLRPLAFKRGVHLTQDADGKFKVAIDESVASKTAAPDLAVRMMLGAGEANIRKADTARAKSPYEIELETWRLALKVADELKANSGKALSDPALLRIQALARDGQLEPAILILMFRQSYRPALEAWLAAHPDGVKAFVERYSLAP